MRRGRFLCGTAVAAAVVLAVPAAAMSHGSGWRVIPTPSPSPIDNGLGAVAVVSASDAWAVGWLSAEGSRTLAEHWDGASWQVVRSANHGFASQRLSGVAAAASDDVWAVGSYDSGFKGTRPLIEHWDGSVWTEVPNPSLPGTFIGLARVAAVSSGDVWAVGSQMVSGRDRTLIEHWDGSLWSRVPSPDQPGDNTLTSVAAVSATDVWAVGYESPATLSYSTLIEHWDGTSWQVVPSPNRPGTDFLQGVAAFSADDVWAVGDFEPPGKPGIPLVERWDGSTWSIVRAERPGYASGLLDVAAAGPDDVWAVGSFSPRKNELARALVMHWDGASWRSVPSPHPGSSSSLFGVATNPTGAWAVGRGFMGGVYLDLAERCC